MIFYSERSHITWWGWPIYLSKIKLILFRVHMIKALFKTSQLKVWLTMYKEPEKLGILLYICLPQNILIRLLHSSMCWHDHIIFSSLFVLKNQNIYILKWLMIDFSHIKVTLNSDDKESILFISYLFSVPILLLRFCSQFFQSKIFRFCFFILDVSWKAENQCCSFT